MAQRGSCKSVGLYVVPHTSQTSPYWSVARQKPRILLAVILCHRARHDMTLLTQALEDIFRVLTIFRTVGRVKTVKRDVEIGKVTLMFNVILGDKILGRHPRT